MPTDNRTTFPGAIVVPGAVACAGVNSSVAHVSQADVKSGNSNVFLHTQYQHVQRHTFSADDLTTEIAADVAKMAFVCEFAGEVLGVRLIAKTAPTGGDKDVDVDVKKNDTTSVLSAVINYSSSQADGEVVDGTLKTDGSEDFVADDYFTFTVTRGGSTGTNLKGWLLEIYVRQLPAAA